MRGMVAAVGMLVLMIACGDAGVIDPDARTFPRPDALSDAGPMPLEPSGCGTCPAPAAGRVSLCGWLRDAETDDVIGTGTAESWENCDELDPRPATGPCAVEVNFYDALMFAGNPTGTAPLQPARLTVNTCGRFIAESLPAPALGFLAIAIDDHGELAPADEHVLSALALPSSAGLREENLTAYAVRRSTDAAWTASAGSPFGASTFVDRGVYLPIFRHRRQPVAGVDVGGEAYYFSDLDPFERTTIDPEQTSTGPNGSVLQIDNWLTSQSDIPGPEGCSWPPVPLADAIPGVYFVERRDSVDANGDVCE